MSRDIVGIDLAWDAYPSDNIVIQAIASFSSYRQPFQIFYHAIKNYVKKIGNEQTRPPVYQQFVAYYFYYGGTQTNLRTGEHDYAYWKSAQSMYAEGYRARVKHCVCCRMCRINHIDIRPPDHVLSISPEVAIPAAACA